MRSRMDLYTKTIAMVVEVEDSIFQMKMGKR